jgi:soluble lytic murein transglycosylase-like protein
MAAQPVANDDVPSLSSSDVAATRIPRQVKQPGKARKARKATTRTARSDLNSTLGGLTTGKRDVDELILTSSRRHGVDPKLVFAVMHQESGFKQRAVSHKGASGYMQLMPATARRFGVTDIFDPAQNIDAGVRYLRFLLDLFDNDVELALAGYNAGEYRVIRSGYRVPRIRETQNYVRLISANYYGRAGRAHRATVGPKKIDEKKVVEIVREAFATTDDRGIAMLTNAY